jgi:methyl-accepting chemotaxis protein
MVLIAMTLSIGLISWLSIKKISDNYTLSDISMEISKSTKDVVVSETNYMLYGKEEHIKSFKENLSVLRGLVSQAKEKYSDQIDVAKYDAISRDANTIETNFDSYVLNEKAQIEAMQKADNLGDEIQTIIMKSLISKIAAKKDINDEFSTEFMNLRIMEKDAYLHKDHDSEKLLTDKIEEVLKINILNQSVSKALADYKMNVLDYISKEDAQEVSSKAIDIADASIEISATEMEAIQAEKMASTMQTTLLILIISILIAVVFSVLMAEIFRRSLSSGIRKSVDYAKRIALGELAFEVDTTYLKRKDEIGELSLVMHTMVEKLKEVVDSVSAGTSNIAAASEEMSANSQSVSQGASEQASSVEEVSSSIEEMSSNIQQNSSNAMQTEKIAIKASKDIEDANTKVQLTIDAIKEIAVKVSIIGDIAFQTNILALNAAVEAARAGEHGRGFAVVASEVRKLAERSQTAANEINLLSKSSVEYAINSGKLMADLVPDIQQTAKLVQEITAASVEQNSGAEQINYAIQQTNQVIQQNAAASEEMATSAEELESQAEQLQEIISFFKTSNTRSNTIQRRTTPVQFKQSKPAATKISANKGINLNMGKSDNLDKEYEKF